MTGNILQSDIDLVRRSIAAGESDAEIIVALGYRKIPPAKAQRLVRDIRAGLQVRPDPEPEAVADPPQDFVAAAPVDHPAPHAPEPGSHPPSPSSEQTIPWFRIAFLLGIGICLAAVFLVNPKARKTTASNPVESTPSEETTRAEQTPAIEIEPQSLRVCSVPLTHENALATLTECLGAAARTNQLADFTIYAFDERGIVLYSQNRTGKDSLLLYFEPVGGANGAKSPFRGTLAVRGKPVRMNTLSKNLLAIPGLALSETTSNVFSGRCGKLDVSFAYLKQADRLSLITIDLD